MHERNHNLAYHGLQGKVRNEIICTDETQWGGENCTGGMTGVHAWTNRKGLYGDQRTIRSRVHRT
jgi:hypothetical protein